jgi:tellurite resistance protein TerC
MEVFFPFAEYWSFYAGFVVFVLGLLALDLGVFHREAHVVKFKESLIWTIVWISLALVFNVVFYFYCLEKFPTEAKRLAMEFLTGFVVEKSLAVDNVFVFVMVFQYFAIPPKYQHRVLFYGIIGALIFRAIFIALGAALMQYEWIVWIFGGFLVLTGIKLMFAPENKIEPEKNPVIRLLRKMVNLTPEFHGQNFMVRIGGKIFFTPLFVALVFLEMSDVIFAIDSVPAIFALTNEPFIVFTSNVFAILGLRAMYFMLGGMVDRFIYIKYGLALVLIFVGLKMLWLNQAFGGKFPIGFSLLIIAACIGGSMLLSVFVTRKKGEKGSS